MLIALGVIYVIGLAFGLALAVYQHQWNRYHSDPYEGVPAEIAMLTPIWPIWLAWNLGAFAWRCARERFQRDNHKG